MLGSYIIPHFFCFVNLLWLARVRLQNFFIRGIIRNMDWTKALENCKLCPVECGADRIHGVGGCGASGLRIAKYYLHPFEEPCISFEKGSGTIFFSGCNLRCAFCQNYEVSRAKRGKAITAQELADIFKELEDMGAENISLVTPSHLIAYLVPAFEIYKPKIPVVYNTGSYEKIDVLQHIDPYVDVYLPDMKFYSSALSKRYLGKEDYFDVAADAIAFMAKKPLVMTDKGKMLSGCIVRHLIMPLCASDSKAIVKWFARELPKDTYLSLMSQYTPFGKIDGLPELSRKVTAREYDSVVDTAFSLGIDKLFIQERESSGEKYIPSWDF